MEEEERAAQSAKLQELIRRGGPEDLQEANRLMKVMAGFDNRHKTDYRAKAAEEVGKIQQKAKLLEERLQNFKQGDKMTEGDVFEVRSLTLVQNTSLISYRNSPALSKAPILRFKRCARKSQTTQRLSPNCWKSMTVYTGPLRDTSLSRGAISKRRRRYPKAH